MKLATMKYSVFMNDFWVITQIVIFEYDTDRCTEKIYYLLAITIINGNYVVL
jgi:hypothetical protein